MNCSPSLTKLGPALVRAQTNIKTATKDAANPFFKSKYATLENVMDSCKDALNKEGIAVLQPVGHDNGVHYVDTVLLHESGEWISSRMALTLPKNMQDFGSAISYARRYSLASMVFIGTNEDDDGEKTMDRPKKSVVSENPGKGSFKPKPVEEPIAGNEGGW
jgi:hypothetical protein